tara:strand:- start:599 stop:1639 length:1041 start_codon:yes stop_codon:yes gene_type:complete
MCKSSNLPGVILRLWILVFLFLNNLSIGWTHHTQLSPRAKKDIQIFISSLNARYSIDVSYLESIFDKVKAQPKALRLIKPSKRKKSLEILWDDYRNLFVNQDNVKKGKLFISENLTTLKKAHEIYGVPPATVAAIIGVETKYGYHQGKFPVFDTLATLAFQDSGRREFFRKELESLILLYFEQKLPIERLKGSYAGALGMPQFMPSSWREFAVDFDQDGKTDLLTSSKDAIGSVANYLNKHGWDKDIPTHSRAVSVSGSNPEQFFTDKLQAEFKYRELKKNGFKDPLNKIPLGLNVSLVDLRLKNKKVIFWLATNNFFAVTKYNRSYKYAAAVLELSEALEDESNL